MSDHTSSPMVASRDSSPCSSAQIPAFTREQEQHQRRVMRAHVRQVSKNEDDLKNTIISLKAELEEAKKKVSDRTDTIMHLQNAYIQTVNAMEAQKKEFAATQEKTNAQIQRLYGELKGSLSHVGSFGKTKKDFTSVEGEMATQIGELKEKAAALEVENRLFRRY